MLAFEVGHGALRGIGERMGGAEDGAAVSADAVGCRGCGASIPVIVVEAARPLAVDGCIVGGWSVAEKCWKVSENKIQPIDRVPWHSCLVITHLAMIRLLGAIALAAAVTARDTFHESLTLHPLPDGKLSVLFEFTTQFSLHHGKGFRTSPPTPPPHPPSLQPTPAVG